jgi:hypothetical protein
MPANVTQDYYAFISYSHEDKSWAHQLYQDLIAKGIPQEKIFLDRPTMEAGDLWREQLRVALDRSCNLVVLWSKKAAASEWVDHELDHFERKVSTPGAELIKVHQRMIFVSLDASNKVYDDIQMIQVLKEENAYDSQDPSNIEFIKQKPDVWTSVVEKVYQSITKDDDALSVSLLIMATTSDRLTNIDFAAVPDFADFTESLNGILNQIQLGTRAELIARYGPQRADWKPVVGNNIPIMSLLNQLRDQINKFPNSTKIRWEPVGDRFWNSADAAIETAEKLARSLAVIVIDPISLYDPRVFRRLGDLKEQGCFDNENAVVLVLSPFTMPQPNIGFRDLIKSVARQIFNDYYQPGVRKIPYARCSVNFGDDLGMMRPVLATIKQYFHQTQSTPRAVQTSVGERG